MNDQISADLQRLIGRVWMAAYEAGKREAQGCPTDAAQMREQALAEAVKWDGADERVRADWSAPESLPPLKRSEVRLKVGDVGVTRDGEELTVREDEYGEYGGRYPFVMSNGVAYMRTGFCYFDCKNHPRDIIRLNNRDIIED